MNRHAGPPPDDQERAVPEPSFAERAKTLLAQNETGTLATASRKHAGHPFASLMPYVVDDAGRALLLISSMAVHTQNLRGDPRASLLVTAGTPGVDPLAAARVTLVGLATTVPAPDIDAVRERYLARHPAAASWVDFDDFAFWRLQALDVYFIGGFGAMGWIDTDEFQQARPDPLADVAGSIVEHMNRDHADALLVYARVYAQAAADEATMANVDRLGFTLRLRDGQRRSSVRIPFPRAVSTADESRRVLIEMLREARR